MSIKILLSIVLAFSGTHAFATLINADDFSLGTDVSHIDPNVSLSWLHSNGNVADGIQTLPVTIQSKVQLPEQFFVGATFSLSNGIMLNLNYNAALNELQSYRAFDALLVSFTNPVAQFGFKAVNLSSDPIYMFLYDSDQQPIGTTLPLRPYNLSPDFWVDAGVPPPYAFAYKYFDKSFNFASDVSYILLGGWDSSTYLYEINASVPEPNILLIFSLGLAMLTIRRMRKTNL